MSARDYTKTLKDQIECSIHYIGFSHDGDLLVSRNGYGELQIWNLDGDGRCKTREYHLLG